MWAIDGMGACMKPVFKVTTGGTTGTTVGAASYYSAASGMFDTVMAIGWEKNSESDTQAAIATCANPVLERDPFAGAIGPLATEYSMYMTRPSSPRATATTRSTTRTRTTAWPLPSRTS